MTPRAVVGVFMTQGVLIGWFGALLGLVVGLLLAFMFIWNMLGALVLLPALAHFLLKPAVSAARAMQSEVGRGTAVEGTA